MSKNPYVRKTYLSKIGNLIGKDLVKVITGMRRTGKSTIWTRSSPDSSPKGYRNQTY